MLIINIKLNYLMVISWFMSISLRAIEMISKMKSPRLWKSKLFALYIVLFQSCRSEIRNKSVVVVTKTSDHNRITSMSCLKKVIDTVETECGKSFTSVVLWIDGKGTQFRSRFFFSTISRNNVLE